MLNVLVNKEYEKFFGEIKSAAPDYFFLELVDFSLQDQKLQLQLSKADAIIGQVNLSNFQYETACKLKIIQTLSAGYDLIDLAKAKQHKVLIANNNGANANSVAEHVLMLILALYRQLVFHHQSIVTGSWTNLKYQNRELQGKTLGIFGLGQVGKALAQIASALTSAGQYDPHRYQSQHSPRPTRSFPNSDHFRQCMSSPDYCLQLFRQ